jgi:hypothetical protein
MDFTGGYGAKLAAALNLSPAVQKSRGGTAKLARLTEMLLKSRRFSIHRNELQRVRAKCAYQQERLSEQRKRVASQRAKLVPAPVSERWPISFSIEVFHLTVSAVLRPDIRKLPFFTRLLTVYNHTRRD